MDLTTAACVLTETVRTHAPIIHCITNLVTINDCANALLAVGASPIMADAPEESDDITAHANALVLNIGQLSPRKLEAMLRSGRQANQMGIPVILDPVGVGASAFRTQAVRQLLEQLSVSILRCNRSEAACIYGLPIEKAGIDSLDAFSITDSDSLARALAARFSCTIAITGETDILADADRLYHLHGGHAMLSRVTGMGCVSSALCGAYAAVCKDPLTASAAALGMMAAAGTLAFEQAGTRGTGSFHTAVLDALSTLDASTLQSYFSLTEVQHAQPI